MVTERRHNLGKIKAVRHNVREMMGIKARRRIVPTLNEDRAAVLSQFAGALMRAFMVMVLVATPSVLLPGVTADGQQMVALVALFLGILTFVEYNATYPGMIEFRDAPPFNRTRFLMLLSMVFFLSIMARGGADPSTLARLFEALGILIGQSLDFPYSPVRLVTLTLADTSTPAHVIAVRSAAGVAYFISLITLAIFALLLRIDNWPTKNGAFNVWTNLPTFDPTVGGDVVARLERDARFNLALGFLLPFLIPAVVKLGGMGMGSLDLYYAPTRVWVMALWAFLPASLFMRGIAMTRIARIIREKRERNAAAIPCDIAA
ncbi:hypothetical protein SAMN05216227_101176 [Pseudorhodobacter antarcticus]|uniref:Uncharacterized protein n=2 Tax=Pseudorhodobacter antarcticus TaxID=1077947 RepID=A0A1H8FQ60_9RHOB|nr:hypothetical protein SAMN05216227_101176 [Pseudorhodobacter antarcticus]